MASIPDLEAAWVPNRGGACTTAAVLAALGALGARALPELGSATLALGARRPYGAPPLLDYLGCHGRPSRLDRRIEALAKRHGLAVRSRTNLVLPGWPLRPRPGQVLVVNLAWGQEAPGRWGSWGWKPLRPATYSTGGHSVVLVDLLSDGGWLVLDPNHPGLQRWPRPGLAVTVIRISRLGSG